MLEVETGAAGEVVGYAVSRPDFELDVVKAEVRAAHVLFPRPPALLHQQRRIDLLAVLVGAVANQAQGVLPLAD